MQKVLKQEQSFGGGMITYFEGRLVHTPMNGAYSGRAAEEGVEVLSYQQAKRGRGRPRKDGGKTYDFSLLTKKVKVPAWKGPRTVHLAPADE
jgi:hypothetical protein